MDTNNAFNKAVDIITRDMAKDINRLYNNQEILLKSIKRQKTVQNMMFVGLVIGGVVVYKKYKVLKDRISELEV